MKISTKANIYIALLVLLIAVSGALTVYFVVMAEHHALESRPETFSELLSCWAEEVRTDPQLFAMHVFNIVSLICFVAVLAISLGVRRTLVEPLSKAVEFSRALADNRFPPKLETPPYSGEITELVASLNFMRDRLQSTFLKLQTSHENEKNARFSAELLTQMRAGFIHHIVPDIMDNVDVIVNNMSIVEKMPDSAFPARRAAISDAVKRAARLIARQAVRLEDLARIGLEKERMSPKTIVCAEFMRFVIKLNAALFETRGVCVEEEYHAGMPESIVADPDVMRMLVTMAIHVIADNSEPGERVLCGCRGSGEHIVFTVRDCKLAAPRDPLYELYNGFVAGGGDISGADKRLTTLMVLREWVDQLGGELKITSGSAKANMEVDVSFNCADLACDGVAAPGTATSQRLSTGEIAKSGGDWFEPTPARILVAEANRDLAATAHALFEADRHTVKTAPDLANLLKVAGEEKFDLVIIALRLSAKTLRGTVEEIHRHGAPNERTPVALVTADSTIGREDFQEDEIRFIFRRPIDFNYLRQVAGHSRLPDAE